MFPVRSDLGSASIDLSGVDPMYEIIEAGKDLERSQMRQPTGLQTVAGMQRQQTPVEQPLRFGGVFDSGSNPGADILNRTAARSMKPTTEPNQLIERPISPDEAHLNRYFDRKNKGIIAESTAERNRELGNTKGWKTVTITDPNDPTKQINARINEITGETQPINLPGVITRTGSAADIQKQRDAEEAKKVMQEGVRNKAQEALNVLNQLQNPDETLRPDTQWITGLSANFGTRFTPGGASAHAAKERLRNLLTLDILQELKRQSKTGATGFGQMNLRELKVLEDAASKLDHPNMREEDFNRELSRIRIKLNELLSDAPNNEEIKPAVSHTNAPPAPAGYEYVRRADNKGWTAVKKGAK